MLVMKNSYILGGQKCIAKISDIFIEFPLFSNTFHLVYQYAHNVIFFARHEKNQVHLPVQKDCALGQVKMKVWWSAGQGKLASVVLLNSITDYGQNLVNDEINNAWTLHTYRASNILVGATENWNVLAHWATGFKTFFPALQEKDKF